MLNLNKPYRLFIAYTINKRSVYFMRRIFCLILAIFTLFVFSACGNKNVKTTTQNTENTKNEDSTTSTAENILKTEEEKDENGNVIKRIYYNEHQNIEREEEMIYCDYVCVEIIETVYDDNGIKKSV